MRIERRTFLGSAIAGTAGMMVGADALWAKPVEVDPTGLVPLGKELKVSRIGCGTGTNGGNRACNQTRMGREKLENLLAYSYDQNVRMYDVADLYGTMPYTGRVLKSKPRDSYILASKIWLHPGALPETERPDADVVAKRFLKELQTDYLDLLQIHCVTKPDWPKKFRRQMDIMEKLKQQGTIRAHGVSCHSLEALEAAAAEPWVDVVHARINPFGHRTDAPLEKLVPALQKIHDAGKGVIGMKLVGEGEFDARQRRESLRYVMGLDCIDVLLIGSEKPSDIDEFKENVRLEMLAQAK